MKRFGLLIPHGPRRVSLAVHAPRIAARSRSAFTLIELLVSIGLTLLLLVFVMQIFAWVSDSVHNARATLELNDRLRSASERLRKDLNGATAEMIPPLSPDQGLGYFEYDEGPLGPATPLDAAALNTSDSTKPADSSVIDKDDLLMLTVRSRNEPFVGRGLVRTATEPHGKYQGTQSPLAEVIWFVRGNKLYRRTLLIQPEFDYDLTTTDKEKLSYTNLYASGGFLFGGKAAAERGFYNNFDLSVRLQYDPSYPGNIANATWMPNTLADLTRRENRFAHQPAGNVYPYDLRGSSDWMLLGMPTLRECSHVSWWPGLPIFNVTLTPETGYTAGQFDAWKNPLPFRQVTLTGTSGAGNAKLDRDTDAIVKDNTTATTKDYLGPRVAEDVILTDVIGFDVKAWDPGAPLLNLDPNNTPANFTDDTITLVPGDPGYSDAYKRLFDDNESGIVVSGYGAYVDLGYESVLYGPSSWFKDVGISKSQLTRVYDTWSTHYEKDGIDQDGDGLIDEGTNGLDDDSDGVVDEADEQEAPPPYDKPLRGIQIKIRVYERDTRQVREVTIVHSFLPE